MWPRNAILLALVLLGAGCSHRETTTPPPAGKLPAEVAGDPESALPKAKRK